MRMYIQAVHAGLRSCLSFTIYNAIGKVLFWAEDSYVSFSFGLIRVFFFHFQKSVGTLTYFIVYFSARRMDEKIFYSLLFGKKDGWENKECVNRVISKTMKRHVR